MIKSTLTIYQFSNFHNKTSQYAITEDRNMIVDNLLDYLNKYATLPNGISGPFELQRVRPYLDIDKKIPMPGLNTFDIYPQESAIQGNYFYAHLNVYDDVGNTGGDYYYFVRNIEYVASYTLRVVLHMDVLNTFKLNVSYGFSPRTYILRTHRDRFNNVTLIGAPNTLLPIIDPKPEGINPTLYYRQKSTLKNSQNYSYYLLYRNAQNVENGPVDVYLCADDSFNTTPDEDYPTYQGTPGTTALNQEFGIAYYFTISDNYSSFTSSIQINFTDGSIAADVGPGLDNNWMGYGTIKYVVMGLAGSKSFIAVASYRDADSLDKPDTFTVYYGDEIDSVVINAASGVRVKSVFNINSESDVNNLNLTYNDVMSLKFKLFEAGTKQYRSAVCSGINSVDRTDTRWIKIIKIPYIPVNDILEGDTYEYPSDYIIDGSLRMIKFVNTNKQLKKIFNYGYTFDGNVNIFSKISSIAKPDSVKEQERKNMYETKVYNSEFTEVKLVYDSFSALIPLEWLTLEENKRFLPWLLDNSVPTGLTFYMTSTINTRFMFDISDYLGSAGMTSDYYQYLIVQRNNEIPLFQNAYINYIRTGYNYDVKTKNRELKGGAASLVSQFTNVALSAITNPKGTAGAFVGAVDSAIHYMLKAEQLEQNIEQKQTKLAYQTTSVYGSEDVDLLSVYNENRLQLFVYQPADYNQDAILDLFYYYGYRYERYGIPDTTSRMYFNYVQCNPIYYYAKLPADCLAEMTEKWQNGVTIFHDVDGVWDTPQEYENFETWMNV